MLIAKKKQFPGSKILLNPAAGSLNNVTIKSPQHREGPRGPDAPESILSFHSNAKQLCGVTGFQVSPSNRDKDASPNMKEKAQEIFKFQSILNTLGQKRYGKATTYIDPQDHSLAFQSKLLSTETIQANQTQANKEYDKYRTINSRTNSKEDVSKIDGHTLKFILSEKSTALAGKESNGGQECFQSIEEVDHNRKKQKSVDRARDRPAAAMGPGVMTNFQDFGSSNLKVLTPKASKRRSNNPTRQRLLALDDICPDHKNFAMR